MLIYSLAIIPVLQRREKIRPIAAQLAAAIPPNESLYAVDPDYQPFLFYLPRPIVYVSKVADLPRAARYLLVQPANEKAAEESHALGTATRGADPADQRLSGTPRHPFAGAGQLSGRIDKRSETNSLAC